MIKAEVHKADVDITMSGHISTIAAESLQIVNYIYNAIVRDYGEDAADCYIDLVRELVASDEFAKKKEKTLNGDLIDFSVAIKHAGKR